MIHNAICSAGVKGDGAANGQFTRRDGLQLRSQG
jgi:hypothetical protein